VEGRQPQLATFDVAAHVLAAFVDDQVPALVVLEQLRERRPSYTQKLWMGLRKKAAYLPG
jgi:hypothetical protein